MNRKPVCCACIFLTLAAVGCGDTPHVVLRDAVTTWNETADILSQLQYDPADPAKIEEDAGRLLKGPLESMKNKWKKVKDRSQKFDKLDKEDKPAFYAAVSDLKAEAKYSIVRITTEVGGELWMGKGNFKPVVGRLKEIRDKLKSTGKPTPNLDACIGLGETFGLRFQTPREDQKKLGNVGQDQLERAEFTDPSLTSVTRYKNCWFYYKSKDAAGGGR